MRFSESQLFPTWLRYGLLMITIFSVAIMIFTKTHPLLTVSTAVILAIVSITFFIWKLETNIDTRRITIEIKPFMKKSFPIEDITEWKVRQYGPIAEFGGWGVRYGFKDTTAYNVSGNIGLDLVINEKTKLLIGTQKGQEIKRILKNVIPEKERT